MAGLVLAFALSVTASPAQAAEISLYDHTNFGGQVVSLTQSTPNLGYFDNRASLVRVISGTWRLYRDTNYQSNNGPSVLLDPGNISNMKYAGFRRNRLSVVRLMQETKRLPSCTMRLCTGPNQVAVGWRGMWRCGRVKSGVDRLGRRLCFGRELARGHVTSRYTVNGAIALAVANRNGFRTSAGSYQSDARCVVAGHLVIVRKKFRPPPVPLTVTSCNVRFFEGRRLASGWRMVDARVRYARAVDGNFGRCRIIRGRNVCRLSGLQQMPPIAVSTLQSVELLSITLEGPRGRNWLDAFARRR